MRYEEMHKFAGVRAVRLSREWWETRVGSDWLGQCLIWIAGRMYRVLFVDTRTCVHALTAESVLASSC